MNGQHPDEFQQLKIAAGAVQSLREFIALDEELDVGGREKLWSRSSKLSSRVPTPSSRPRGQFAH